MLPSRMKSHIRCSMSLISAILHPFEATSCDFLRSSENLCLPLSCYSFAVDHHNWKLSHCHFSHQRAIPNLPTLIFSPTTMSLDLHGHLRMCSILQVWGGSSRGGLPFLPSVDCSNLSIPSATARHTIQPQRPFSENRSTGDKGDRSLALQALDDISRLLYQVTTVNVDAFSPITMPESPSQ